VREFSYHRHAKPSGQWAAAQIGNLLKKIRLLSKQEAQKMRSWNREREGRTLAIAGSREGKLIYPSAHARVVMALLVVGALGCA